MITPFDRRGALDLAAARALSDFLLTRGVDVLFPCGTTGEGMLLDLDERRRLAETVVEHAGGRAPVMIHTGCITTADTVALTRHARDCGASAASVITPYFHPLDDDALFEHFLAVARSTPDFPIFLYAFPANARNTITPSLVRRLRAAAENIVGMKTSNADMILFQDYMEAGGGSFSILCGVDGLMLPALGLGAEGEVSGNANAFPEPFVDLLRAFRMGDLENARKCQRTINRLRSILRDGAYPACYKAVLWMRGVPVGTVRPPMRELTPSETEAMRAALVESGFIE